MSNILDVVVNISTAGTAGYLGFGIPLILVSKATKAVPYTECGSANEVATAVGDTDKTSDSYKIAKLIFMQDHAPQTVAVYHSTETADKAIESVEEKGWRQLIAVIGEGDTTTIKAIADVVEALDNKLYFVTGSEISGLGALNGLDRTVAFYHNLKDEDGDLKYPYAVAALVGETAGRPAGSFTYKNLILKGIEPLDLTSAEIADIHTAGLMTFVTKAGDNVTTEGKVTSGEYIDIVDAKDYIISQIEYRVQKLLNNASKLPYTNAGIAAIEAEVVGVLNDAYANGIIDTKEGVPDYSVNFKTREQMSATERANRIYSGGNFSFTLAGAIHTVTINGELVI